MNIRKTAYGDRDQVDSIYTEARGTIAALGIDQWQNGYPAAADIDEDISLSRGYVIESNGEVCGTFALITDGEPLYDYIEDGHWLTGDDSRDYYAMHRVAIAVSSRGSGLSREMIGFAAELARDNGMRSLRIDTHRGNVVMRRMLEKNGFIHCGTIYLKNGDPRVAYELLL